MSSVIIVGNWDDIFQGPCLEFEHRPNKASSLKFPSSVLKDFDCFADLLQQNDPASLQLTSEDPITPEDFLALLNAIGNNCPKLECLGMHLKLREEDEAVEHSSGDLDLATIAADHGSLSQPQKAFVEGWRSFIGKVKSTFQHIAIVGDLTIPYFALQLVLVECPKFEIIDGAFSGRAEITNTKELQETIAAGQEKIKAIVFIDLLKCQNFDLGSIAGNFSNLRLLFFDWSPGLNLKLLEHAAMKNLTNLYVVNPELSDELCTGQRKKKKVQSQQIHSAPRIDLFLPQGSKLRELTMTGLDLSEKSWGKFAESAKYLKWIYVQNGGFFDGKNLESLGNLERLEVLSIDASNSVIGEDLIPLVTFSEELVDSSRFQFNFKLKKNAITSDKEIAKTVNSVLGSLKEITDESIEGKVGVSIEYWHHTGGFEFLRKSVEAMGFTFDRDEDEESKIWNCNLSDGSSSDRYLSLIEEEKPSCELEFGRRCSRC